MSSLKKIAGSSFSRNVVVMLLGQGGKIGLQGLYFVVIARFLGVREFGAFAGVVAMVALVAPLFSLGAASLVIRNVVRDRQRAAEQYATALSLTFLSGLVVTGVLLVLERLITPAAVTPWILVCVAAADLFASRFVDVAACVYIANEEMKAAAKFQVAVQAARSVGAVMLLVLPFGFTLQNWAFVYMICTWMPAIGTMVSVFRTFGAARPDWRGYRDDWRQGLLFSVSLSSQSVYNDIDKAMLAKLSTLEATGIYTAAYRIIDMAFIPVRALLWAANPRFFREGQHGLARSLRVAHRLLGPGAGYGVTAGLALVVCAPLVPVVLGSDYDNAVGAIRALAVLPLIKVLHYLPSDALTGSGRQGPRSVVQLTVAVLNLGLNVVLIPRFGYWGAVWASLGADGGLAIAIWAILLRSLRRERGAAAERGTDRAA